MIVSTIMTLVLLFNSYICINGSESRFPENLLSQECQNIFTKWKLDPKIYNLENSHIDLSSFINPFEDKMDTIESEQEIIKIHEQFKKIISLYGKKQSAEGTILFITRLIQVSYENNTFNKKIKTEKLFPYCIQSTIAGLSYDYENLVNDPFDYIVMSASVVNYFIYNYHLPLNGKATKGFSRSRANEIKCKDPLKLKWINESIKDLGFILGDISYNTVNKNYLNKHFTDQTPEFRVAYFKEMLKPRLPEKLFKCDIYSRNRWVKDKEWIEYEAFEKMPTLCEDLKLEILERARKNVQNAVNEYKKELSGNTQDEGDKFLCNDFDQWYAQELKQCTSNK